MNKLQDVRLALVKRMNGIVIPPKSLMLIYKTLFTDSYSLNQKKYFTNFIRFCLNPEYYPFLAVYDVEAVYYAAADKREDYLLTLIDAFDDDFADKYGGILEESVSNDTKMYETMFFMYQLLLQDIHYGHTITWLQNETLKKFCKFSCFNKKRPVEGNCMHELIDNLLSQRVDYHLYYTYCAIFCGFSYVQEASLPTLVEAMEKHKDFLEKESKSLKRDLTGYEFQEITKNAL